MQSPICISSFKTIFVCFSKEVFRLMSDRSLGWLLHSPCRGIRRVCVVDFGPETKKPCGMVSRKGGENNKEHEEMTWPSKKTWSWSQAKASPETQFELWKALGRFACCSPWVDGCAAVLDQQNSYPPFSSPSPVHPCSGQGHRASAPSQTGSQNGKRKTRRRMYEGIWLNLNDSHKWCGARALGAFEGKSRYLILGCGGLLWSWQRAAGPLRRRLTELGRWDDKRKHWCNPAFCERQH